jgi:hypothetical protein
MTGDTPLEVSRHPRSVESGGRSHSIGRLDRGHSATGLSEICQSLPSNTEMKSVFIGV